VARQVIDRLGAPVADDDVAGLASLLCELVESGQNIGFLRGLTMAAAAGWWRQLLADPDVLTWVARGEDGVVLATSSLRLAAEANARHRAEVTKLLVREAARRRGLASALMAAVEEEAVRLGRSVLMLDTEAGSAAELFYESRGWIEYGLMPEHAADPDGVLRPTRFYWKPLKAEG
jgi:GNAT superfamily N-acetyltransferase